MDQSSVEEVEEQKYGRCIICKQIVSTSLMCHTCDSDLKERKHGTCKECKQIKPINTGYKYCHTCELTFKEKKFGRCTECKQIHTGQNWCQTCNSKRFQQNFSNWTSGNDDVDKFIQNNQLSAKNEHQLLEWIPYDRFYAIKYIAKGGFGKVYEASWKDSCISHWNVSKHKWQRYGINKQVALKSLNDSQNLTLEFINEMLWDKPRPDTKEYIMVMSYAKRGNLQDYFKYRKSHNMRPYKKRTFDFKLRHKLAVLEQILSGLKRIHEKGLIHRDLHVGNIVCLSSSICITDMGLCKPANYMELENAENNVYGVLPYIAPEILRGEPYTQASDIYSFGIIMYEVISELRPYYDIKDHDEHLVIMICEGLRPRFKTEVPKLILQLIKSCLDAIPSNRPNVRDILRTFHEWLDDLSTYINSTIEKNQTELIKTEIVIQLEGTEKINDSSSASNLPSMTNNLHSGAIYSSRLLNFKNLPEPKNSDDYYEIYDNISSMEYSEVSPKPNSSECLECVIED